MVGLTLGLAGQAVCLELDDRLAPLVLRSDPLVRFTVNAPAVYTVHVGLAAGDQSAPAAERIIYDNGGAAFELAQATGRFDPRQRVFTVEIRRPQQAVIGLRRVLMYVGQLVALEAGGILLRAAGVVSHGRGYACFGPSGAGKTTLMHLALDAGLPVLGDEALLLIPQGDAWFIHSFPYWEPDAAARRARAEPLVAPLAGLLHLRQAPAHAFVPLTPAQLMVWLLDAGNVALNNEPDRQRWLQASLALTQTVPGYDLCFRPDIAVWHTVQALSSSSSASSSSHTRLLLGGAS